MNALLELSRLAVARPAAGATADAVAAWYQAKGRLHEHLAAAGAESERAGELSHAAAAYEHARRLLATAPTTMPAGELTRADVALAGVR